MAHKRNVRRGTTARNERKARLEQREQRKRNDRLTDDIILLGSR